MKDIKKQNRLSIIIPVYNEIKTIDIIFERVSNASPQLEKEIIIVDDCSTDGTRERLKERFTVTDEEAVKVLYHGKNRGKGAAVRTGLSAVTGDICIIQDADLEYDPSEYNNLLTPILDGRADVVFGSRFLGGPHRVLFFWHFLGNRFLTMLSNIFTNINLTDMETCYKAFRTEIIKKCRIRSDRFGFEPEITAKMAKLKCRIYETPISYSGRDYSEGKKITWKDGLKAMFCIIWFHFFD